jgi:hypothetical protein
MDTDLTNSKTIKSISAEQVERAIRQALGKLIWLKREEAFEHYRAYILKECEHIKQPFADLIGYYLKNKEEENFDQIVKAFLTYYDRFASGFRQVIASNQSHKFTCFLIAVVWLEVIEGIEMEAKKVGDFVAWSIALQLQTDIHFTIEGLYPDRC